MTNSDYAFELTKVALQNNKISFDNEDGKNLSYEEQYAMNVAAFYNKLLESMK